MSYHEPDDPPVRVVCPVCGPDDWQYHCVERIGLEVEYHCMECGHYRTADEIPELEGLTCLKKSTA